MIWNRDGVTREVFLIGRYAIKLPKLTYGWKLFLEGLLANMQEREFSTSFRTPELCPVVFSIAGGWLVVMRRAQPLTESEWDAFFRRLRGFGPSDELGPECSFHARDRVEPWIEPSNDYIVPVEMKQDSFGMLDGRIVAVDYGN